MSSNYISVNNLKVSSILLSFVNEELLKDIDISSEKKGSFYLPVTDEYQFLDFLRIMFIAW